jgi:hypothetical protein
MAYNDILSDLRGFACLYQRERLLEQRERWGAPFQCGITPNKSGIDAFLEFNVEQGMTR